MARPFFTRERISDFDIYDKNCFSTLQLARTRLAEGYPIEFQVIKLTFHESKLLPSRFSTQDLASRFTLDSATEFLFGHNVGSLSANIPYPASAAHLNKPSFYNHPSTIFAKAFTEGQNLSTNRSFLGEDWPLGEFWSDKVASFRKVIDNFTEPLMEDALARRNIKLSKGADAEDDNENSNLLAYLVEHTQGMLSSMSLLCQLLNVFLWDALDRSLLKDEVVSLSSHISVLI